MFALFVRETYPPEVTAMGAALALLVAGVLPADEVLQVFSNPAPWTIVAMFILSGGLVRTGVLAHLSLLITSHAKERPKRTMAALALITIVASAFMNNTPIVVVMIPIVVQLAQTFGLAPSKLLIPLSYITIMGGMWTLIGTSTNLLVDGVARTKGMEPFTLFEILPLGLILSVAGVAYLATAGRFLLPVRDSMVDMLGPRKRMRFFTEVVVPDGSPLVDSPVMDVALFRREGMRVIDVIRGDESLRRQFPDVMLEIGDRVVLRTDMKELLGLKDSDKVTLVDRVGSKRTTTVEALISPDCKLVGRSLGSLRLRRRYGVYPLAVHRRNQNIGRQLDDVVVRVGDTLLLEGAPEDIRRLATEVELVDIAEPSERPFKRGWAPLMVGILAAVVLLAAFNVAPIHILALVGVAAVLLIGIMDNEEAYSNINGQLIALIFAMLAVGVGLESSGAMELIVGFVAPMLMDLPPFLVIFAVYGLSMFLTELVTNNAVAIVVTPLAIALAQELGIDPRPLVVAVMFAASASFSTPIGYQTNTLVYGPGGYRFTDYFRVGIPLNLLMWVLSCFLIPIFWPFVPS
ncbi:SLC13 family permease [Amaricoccus macauensis]|uniref:SLC13 family permease n=1 Tax=Amaricoccus macauensis TaxID=57001 RepID=UPI003C7CE056